MSTNGNLATAGLYDSSTLATSTATAIQTESTTTTAAAAAVVEVVDSVLSSTVGAILTSTIESSTFVVPKESTATTARTFQPETETSNVNHVKMSVADLSSSLQHFGVVDYAVFIMMLVICAAIGFYFGFIEKKAKSTKKSGSSSTGANADTSDLGNVEDRRGSEALDYLVGGRKMKVLPVSLSLVASFVSGISLLGTSTEIYVYGTQYAFILITLAISGVISWYIFLPVFCNLQLTSTYEYFELRFNKSVRLLGSTLFTVGTIVWLPIVIYVPALAFNQVTGVNLHVITPVVCIICIFYTCVGGLKAVIWTDVVQTVVMIGAIILVIIKGTNDVGGIAVLWQRNFDSGRIELPEFTLDHTTRLSVFAILIGQTFFYTQVLAGNQVLVQRYLSLPGLKEVKRAIIWSCAGIMCLLAMCMYNGLLLFATYYDCDPLSTKLAKEKDQLMPLLIMRVLGDFPGLAGLFVAGIFSAALSSLSTGLNSLAAVFLEDYIRPLKKSALTQAETAIVMRLTVVLIGALCVVMVFVVQRSGTHVIQLSLQLGSVINGPLLGMFLMGLLMPTINAKSAFTGGLASFFIMTWLFLKAFIAKQIGEIHAVEKPVTTQGCNYSFDSITAQNITMLHATERTFAQQIYHVSFAYYAFVGATLAMVIGYCATWIFGRNDWKQMDLGYFAPCLQRFLQPTHNYSNVLLHDKDIPMSDRGKSQNK